MGIGGLNRKAVFLDRDGVLNALVLNPATGRMESPLTPGSFRLLDNVIPALCRLQSAGYALILVSNQPNYALGKSSLQALGAIHYCLGSTLIASGIRFSRFCYCLHHPRGVTPGYSGLCVCRKPSPWFLLRARDDLGLCLRNSWMIGDQPTDTHCGRSARVRTIRLTSGAGPHTPPLFNPLTDPCADYCARNLADAVDLLLGFS